ncbi:MAG: shikimate dehydrogenase, partial [Bacteroidia bacterium]
TTPLGSPAMEDECVSIPYNAINAKHLCYDLIYKPEESLFLKKAKEKGATIKNGLEMLQIQADESWKIWDI